ncbi:hypothetical protein FPV16_07960 [Methylobacterium sp. W2]|nr:hypothetical protein [Methylobacterium sp. W2]
MTTVRAATPLISSRLSGLPTSHSGRAIYILNALTHAVENRVKAVNRRGDLLAKRREMMETWAQSLRTNTLHNSCNTEI